MEKRNRLLEAVSSESNRLTSLSSLTGIRILTLHLSENEFKRLNGIYVKKYDSQAYK